MILKPIIHKLLIKIAIKKKTIFLNNLLPFKILIDKYQQKVYAKKEPPYALRINNKIKSLNK